MEMSSSNPVRGDPLPDWLQPFDENLVNEEEQRGDRVELHEDMQDDDRERKGVVAQGERARPLPQPRLPSRQEVQEHELTHIPYRSWCVHCVRGAGRSDAHRRRARQDEEEREQHMTTWTLQLAALANKYLMKNVSGVPSNRSSQSPSALNCRTQSRDLTRHLAIHEPKPCRRRVFLEATHPPIQMCRNSTCFATQVLGRNSTHLPGTFHSVQCDLS